MNTVSNKRRSSVHQSASRRLFLEGLENRSVLAGDVWAASLGGNLIIHGDADANGIHIQQMSDGSVQISGLEAGGSATTVNGSDQPFVAEEVRFLTRVNLGNGDDMLKIDSEGSSNSGSASGSNDTDSSSSANVAQEGSLRARLGNLLNGIRNGLTAVHAQQQLLINTGRGNDTIDAEISDNVRVHLLGNLTGDSISIQPISGHNDDSGSGASGEETNNGASSGTGTNGDMNSSGSATGSMTGGNFAGLNPNTNAAANLEAIRGSNLGANPASSLDANIDAGVNSALNADLNAAVDVAANATLGGIGLQSDLDSALVASLASNNSLNSSANVGTSSLLNTDNDLNGSIGGAAALNLAGDHVFDEVGLFNLASLANLNANAAGSIASSNGNSFGLNSDAVDNFFASQSNLNTDAGVLANLGLNAATSNGNSLNTNIDANLNGAFQSRLALVPLA